jgi:hypothetical protein
MQGGDSVSTMRWERIDLRRMLDCRFRRPEVQAGGTLLTETSVRHRNDHVSLFMSSLDIRVSFRDFIERVTPIDDYA